MKRSEPKTKKYCQQHAIRRAYERYGLTLTYEQCNQISNLIKKFNENGKSDTVIFVDKKSIRISRYKVLFNDVWLPVAYDKLRKTIVSVLPKDCLNGDRMVECPKCPWKGNENELRYGCCPKCGAMIPNVDNEDPDEADILTCVAMTTVDVVSTTAEATVDVVDTLTDLASDVCGGIADAFNIFD